MMKKNIPLQTIFLIFFGIALYVPVAYADEPPLVTSGGSCSCNSGNTALICQTTILVGGGTPGAGFMPGGPIQTFPCPNGCDPSHQPPGCNDASSSQVVAAPAPALQYTPLEPLPFINYQDQGTVNFFPNLINGIFKVLLSVGAVFAVVMIVLAGISYMTSEVAGKKNAAKKRAQAAVMGLLLLLGAYLILKEINPNLLNVSLNLTPVGTSSTTSQTTGTAVTSLTTCSGLDGQPEICATGDNKLIYTAQALADKTHADCTPDSNGNTSILCPEDTSDFNAAVSTATHEFQDDQNQCSSFIVGNGLVVTGVNDCSKSKKTVNNYPSLGVDTTYTHCVNIPNPSNTDVNDYIGSNAYYMCLYNDTK